MSPTSLFSSLTSQAFFLSLLLQQRIGATIANSDLYTVKSCLTDKIGDTCNLQTINRILYLTQPVNNPSKCEETVGQLGSLSFADLTLPPGKVLYIEVTTKVSGQNGESFFVRPSEKTKGWGTPSIIGNGKTALFYLADTGQYSIEFAPSTIWRDITLANNFDALMLFVDPPLTLPPRSETETIPAAGSSGDSKKVLRILGPNKSYRFRSDKNYDWNKEIVFRVMDNTEIWFEEGAYVRARIVQTTAKVKNVKIQGRGVLDNAYPPDEYDIPGLTDDGSRQTIHILGKNIHIRGLTLINTNEDCYEFGYALNINANWAPIQDPSDVGGDVFEAGELQGNPPYKFRKAHCQDYHMDDSPNTNFLNCPTNRKVNGNKVEFVKAISWQMGQDGLNAGKHSTVSDSFIRVVDDAIKPWDTGALYTRITIWQLPLGWPINLGWWSWTSDDKDTIVDTVYVIHNQNWMTSDGWPTTKSGQCVVGGVYGSSAVKSNYKIRNIYVETACSCAVGLEISKTAYNRHLTSDGCVGSMKDLQITNMYFDEEFFTVGSKSKNFVRGEANPNGKCTGDLRGRIENLVISGRVAGSRDLTKKDFVIPKPNTVPGLTFKTVDDKDSPTAMPVVSPPMGTPTAQPVGGCEGNGPKQQVRIEIQACQNPTKVRWTIKPAQSGCKAIAKGKVKGVNPCESYNKNIQLRAGTKYKIIVTDKNAKKKDTFYEVWNGGDVLVTDDAFGKRSKKNFLNEIN